MGTKDNPGKFDCHERAEADEPRFTLLARDPIAPMALELWVFWRLTLVWMGLKPSSDRGMIDEAQDCASQMRAWRREHRNDGLNF